jgi:alkyldihydroxyacetonephosphate synthase
MRDALAPLADNVLGHFSHAYVDGTSLYLILLGCARDDVEAVHRLESIWEVAISTALAHGAAMSHHHGVGEARRRYLAVQLGPAVEVLAKLQRTLDPQQILHPRSLRPDGGATRE